MIENLPDHCFHESTALKASAAPTTSHRRFWRMVFRFLNIVEPGPELVLSPTRVGLWIMMGVIAYVLLTTPGNLPAVLSAVAGAIPFVANFIHQRINDSKVGGNPNETGVTD